MGISRRDALTGIAATGAALGVAGQSAAAAHSGHGKQPSPANFNPPMAAKRPMAFDGLLLNTPRAMDILAAEKVDLLICANEDNFYYLTNSRPPSFLLGMGGGLDFASLSAHGDGKPAMITGSITLYFGGFPKSQMDLLRVQQYSIPVDPEVFATLTDPVQIAAAKGYPSFLPMAHDKHPIPDTVAYRRAMATFDPAKVAASAEAALLREILENPLPNKTIAVDNPHVRQMIEKSGLDVRVVDGEQLIRNIRVQKSAVELDIMRWTATSNAASGRAAAMAAREGAEFHEIRAEFRKEAATRGMDFRFMLIDGVIPDTSGGKIAEGRTFPIDCVSTFRGYHGDYGRTVCVGEPTREMQTVISGLSMTWDRIREALRPGMDYNEIKALGTEIFKDIPIEAGFGLNPHSCGLNHSDDPNYSYGDYTARNTTLVEGMVLSIDLPFLDVGLGGTAHLEDLVIITKDGPELINDSSDRFIVV